MRHYLRLGLNTPKDFRQLQKADTAQGEYNMEFAVHNSGLKPFPLFHALDKRGAAAHGHSGSRTLKDHLIGTCQILKAWNQPIDLCLAGLFHSGYATEFFPHPLFDLTERGDLRRLIGVEAEERVFLFCTIDRRDLLRQLSGTDLIPETGLKALNFRTQQRWALDQGTVADLLLIEMANMAEQMSGDGMGPGQWMASVSRLGYLVREVVSHVPPIFNNCTVGLRSDDEGRARTAYLQGCAALSENYLTAKKDFAEAHSSNPWVFEPQILLGLMALDSADWGEAKRFADQSINLLRQWGTAWDKRRSWAEWNELAERVKSLAERAMAG